MRRILTAIVLMLFSVSANAAPSTTQIGTTKTSNPYPVSILYNGTWYPMGVINTTSGYFLTKVENGGTGLSTGTSGGIPYFASTSTMQSSTALTQYGIVYGGGAGLAPSSTAAGATDNILKGNGAAAPTFASLSSIIDSALTASTQGSILYRGASSWAALGPGTSGQFLKTFGSAANPAWAAASATYIPLVDAVGVCGVDNTGATDTLTSLNSCLNTYRGVQLRAGIYQVSGTVALGQGGTLKGVSRGPVGNTDTTSPYASVIKSTSSTASIVSLGTASMLDSVMIDRYTPDTAATAGCGIDASDATVVYSTWTTISNFWVVNAYNGVCLGNTSESWVINGYIGNNYNNGLWLQQTAGSGTVTYQWILKDIVSYHNSGYGYAFTTTGLNTTVGSAIGLSSYANGLGGYIVQATGGGSIADLNMNQFGSSSDCSHGMLIDAGTGSINNIIANFGFEQAGLGDTARGLTCGHISASTGLGNVAATNAGFGIYYVSGQQLMLNNGMLYANKTGGLGIDAVGSINVTGVLFSENGQAPPSIPNGIYSASAINLTVTGSRFDSPFATNKQVYGIYLSSTGATGVIANNTFKNTTTKAIYSNATGASSFLVIGNEATTGGCTFVAGSTKPSGTSATLNNGTGCP